MTSYFTTRWTWRRLDRLSSTAALVTAGRLDVSAPVRAERAPDEIDEVSLAFNAMLDRMGRLVDQLRQVTRDVAHDMRKPMTRLRQKLDRVGRSAHVTPALPVEIERLDADFREILRTFDALLQLAEIEGVPVRTAAPIWRMSPSGCWGLCSRISRTAAAVSWRRFKRRRSRATRT